ncbi:DNA translocase FtsK [Staphylococcus sp. SQ8-PEA]|uniref:DNA translocase FtsK n=1 Tax=Staphylococcus marylandisciuri TaxID=2981529 RepID=A0ABT2QS43_9STAP|nr:DNA translocase FtsK [Staphylococcus marylandisciuri]MCU5746757.1 DNA translocase FtsK [Staphylococcus marylandisciuri]
MAQSKKKTTNKKSSQTRKKRSTKNKSESPLRYIIAVIILILLVLGTLQLGIIGQMIDSFFNYLFGWSRYLTYVLILIYTIAVAFYKAIPKTRPAIGVIVLQFATLFLFQIIFRLAHTVKSEREPVLIHVYRSYAHTHFPNYGGGLLGFYLIKVFEPLISIVGVVIITLLLIISGCILLTKRRHRDVAKDLFDNIKVKSQSASERMKDRRKENKVKKEAKARLKAERTEERKAQAKNEDKETVTDVSEFPEVPQKPSQSASIPIYGHSDSSDRQDAKNESKRIDNAQMHETSSRSDDERGSKTHSGAVSQDDNNEENSISEAGEVENEAYQVPPLSLLNRPPKQQTTTKSEVQKKGRLLENTLKNFGVDAKVTQIKIGPAVTQYEIQPAQGVKVSKIVNLHSDIALALAAKDVRIEAPIPGKSAVGIEVPNDKVSLVSLKEVLEESFPAQNKLEVGLGRDISGDPITVQLNEMPHLLVAGSTGSGKSVCINGIITSILLNAKPHEVKLMLIDPKMVELNVYNGIPHLLIPVVTNPHKASQALEKIVAEMERRYDLFQHSSTRNIEGYNQYIRRQNQELNEKQAELPYIVVIVDELADLMMVAGKEVENAIQRITQMARAAGIHLIVATQRPSVDVITGLIKNNIPSRIAFAVSSQTDSRTILGASGAEKLLGKGDMLYEASGGSTNTRVQGAFLSDQEVQTVVNYVVEQQKANYVKEMEPDAPVDKSEMQSEDSLYEEAYAFVVDKQKASTSLLQRQFRIGYNRASRLMDDLEQNQVIGPQKGSKPRQILVEPPSEEE